MAEQRHVLRVPLPYQPPRRKRAWALSVAVHIFAVGLVLWLMQRRLVPPPQAPDHMVFIEPAPPPPPPLGVPGGAPMAPVVPVPPEPVVQQPKQVVKPHRLTAPRKIPHKPPPPRAAALPSGAAEGSVGGVAGGVVGGEAGGKVGGVVGGHGDAPFPADRVEHPPVVLTRVLPVYPIAARARNLEGRVVLRAVVDREGRVEEAITVVKSIPLLDVAAVDALRRWRFQPGRNRDGQPVRVVVDVPIRFQLR